MGSGKNIRSTMELKFVDLHVAESCGSLLLSSLILGICFKASLLESQNGVRIKKQKRGMPYPHG